MSQVALRVVSDMVELPGVGIGVRGLSAWYRNKRALREVDLELRAGEVTALIGPSGCGKSTFLRCLNRMHELVPGARAEGEVLLDGEDVHRPWVDPVLLRRRVGMVFQKPNPFPSMSVRENVLAGLRLTGALVGAEADSVVERALRRAALWGEVRDRLSDPGVSLSGGQQQRLCIARALAVEPEVLLLDEPCSALDPGATARIEALISELRAEVTVVIVTHNMQQARRLSDRTVFFLDGEVIEAGTTRELFRLPRDPRTADYLAGRFG